LALTQYPGTVIVLAVLAFVSGMLALYLHIPQGLWRIALAVIRAGYWAVPRARRLVARCGATARQVLRQATSSARNRTAGPRLASWPGRSRIRLAVLDADPISRRLRAEQLRVAVADLGKAHFGASAGRVAMEVAARADYRGTNYLAYLLRDRTRGVTRIRLASRTPGGIAIDVDAQHTHLADLFDHLVRHDPTVDFVGLPAANPASPFIAGTPASEPAAPERRAPAPLMHRRAGALPVAPAPDALVSPDTPAGDDPSATGPDIPYDDCDAPAA
jgi:hypothetical protein